jgi:hypothetical protein
LISDRTLSREVTFIGRSPPGLFALDERKAPQKNYRNARRLINPLFATAQSAVRTTAEVVLRFGSFFFAVPRLTRSHKEESMPLVSLILDVEITVVVDTRQIVWRDAATDAAEDGDPKVERENQLVEMLRQEVESNLGSVDYIQLATVRVVKAPGTTGA